jgi:hypothetical protein
MPVMLSPNPPRLRKISSTSQAGRAARSGGQSKLCRKANSHRKPTP